MFFIRVHNGHPTPSQIKQICQYILQYPKANERLAQEDITLLLRIIKLHSNQVHLIEQDWNVFVQRFSFIDRYGHTRRFYSHHNALYLCDDAGWNEVKRFQ